jgi:hypothetical protein
MITQEKLKEILEYDPDTGIFRWKLDRGAKTKTGDRAGYNHAGYRRIEINDVGYLAHRLVWLYIYGYIPTELDHINGIKHDNRLCNLREASRKENSINRNKRTDNSSGYKGVNWHKAANKWQARIMVNGKRLQLGWFETPEDAYLAYCAAAKEFHGEFANFG